MRSEALGRPHLKVARQTPEGQKLWVGPSHPAQKLFNRVNPWYTRGDLWRATEIYLSLWGSAFWALEKNLEGDWEIWPLRPDRVSVLPDKTNYIRGFVYRGLNGPVAYTPDEILWLRYFNPMEEYAGHSPLAPARLMASTRPVSPSERRYSSLPPKVLAVRHAAPACRYSMWICRTISGRSMLNAS